MSLKVCKFGGTSLATTESIKKVCDIVRADPDRRIIVVSAPGKRDDKDIKVTDLLLNVSKRFSCIEQEFNIDAFCRDYLISRGEYLMARILAQILGFEFVDLDRIGAIVFDSKGQVDLETSQKNFQPFVNKRVVVPGFYGLQPNGEIKTFSRGGSDISAAILAGIAGADLYENWTDVDGVFDKDPNKFDCAVRYDAMSYEDLENLARSGADVLHPDCMRFVSTKGIPINIRNTFNSKDQGTFVKLKEEIR